MFICKLASIAFYYVKVYLTGIPSFFQNHLKPSDQNFHLAVFHILPVLAYALLGFFLGPKLLKW